MITSRAEHRLMLSQNNAEQRLIKKAHAFGLIDKKRAQGFSAKEKTYTNFFDKKIKNIKIQSFTNSKNEKIKLNEKTSILKILKRTDVCKENIIKISKTTKKETHLLERAMLETKYSGYIEKQKREIEKNKKQNTKKIPTHIVYNNISGLSNEVKEKLINAKPTTIGAASRLEGVTPAAINLILVHIKKTELKAVNV